MKIYLFATLHSGGQPIYVRPSQVHAVIQIPTRSGSTLHVGSLGEIEVDEQPGEAVAALNSAVQARLIDIGKFLVRELGGDA